jgi:hypothetical protein
VTPYPLLVGDLDGTLLEDDGSISPRTAAAVAALRAAGVRVAIATGRIPRGIGRVVEALGLDGPQITMHGGLVIDVASGERIYSETFPPAELDELLALTAELALPTLLCYPHGFRTNLLTQGVIDLFVPYNEPLPEVVADLAALRASEPHKVAVWTGDEGYEAALARATQLAAGRWAITSGDNRSLEFLPHGVNKAHAAVALARWLGMELSEVAAIGDGTNDIELLTEVGRSVAMRHARPEVRAAATLTIPADLPDDAASAIALLYPELVADDVRLGLEAAGR